MKLAFSYTHIHKEARIQYIYIYMYMYIYMCVSYMFLAIVQCLLTCTFVTIIRIKSIISNLFRVGLGQVRQVEVGGVFLLSLKIVTTKIVTIIITIKSKTTLLIAYNL